MKKPWSISTTVRNPERLRYFLKVLKMLEGEEFSNENQIKYQVLLIKERLYRPNDIDVKYKKYYEDPTAEMPYPIAKEIFDSQNYEDPPMRGRQSVNPLNKLGFSIAREGYGPIQITALGKMFLEGEYDIGFIFFKSLLKLQFPNPWSQDFSEKSGFNIMPFVSVLHMLRRLNGESEIKGLSSEEFCLFVPTLINAEEIQDQVEKVLKFRKAKGKSKKREYIVKFARQFYQDTSISERKINNFYDYGDNTMRYFRLTRYFRAEIDPLGRHWRLDLEPTRTTETEQIVTNYDGRAAHFRDVDEYLSYISDVTKPRLPWEQLGNLREIGANLRDIIRDLVVEQDLTLEGKDRKLLDIETSTLGSRDLELHIDKLRKVNLTLRLAVKKRELIGNIGKIQEAISILENTKTLRKLQPERFEKLVTETLQILNDEVLIKPNYPVDDEGEPISHSPGNKPDIECFYEAFKAICEVTLNTSNLQWVQEGQPIMRHLRDFENQHGFENIFCVFVAPKIHKDTYSQFWISARYEYDGKPQKIIPLTARQFSVLLRKSALHIKDYRKFTHQKLYELYDAMIDELKTVDSFSEWMMKIDEVLNSWFLETK